MSSRKKMVQLLQSWIGKKESDGSYLSIIEIYNSQKKFPRGLRMLSTWSWCACTVSSAAITLGYTDIIPVEISCGEMVKLAKEMGIWQENDGYVPKPADLILYDWDDNGKGDNTGWPDHIGVIEAVRQDAGYFTVIEGNYGNAVKPRTVSINGKYIRGFITPKYTDDSLPSISNSTPKEKTISDVAHEVIAGAWGNGDRRADRLRKAGWDPVKIQKKVNEILEKDMPKDQQDSNIDQPYNKRVIASCKAASVDSNLNQKYKTTANLYCRNDAGSNKKALCLIQKGTTVRCLGQRTGNWYLIECVIDRILYRGFSHNSYLTQL